MSFIMPVSDIRKIFGKLQEKYNIYAPKRFPKQGRFSDTDVVRYDLIHEWDEIVFDCKSTYPMKEVLTPIQETMFYFTEDEYRESRCNSRPILVFGRPCDINAMEIQAKIYASNGGFADIYYERMRERVSYALMDCYGGDDTCFCVSMGSNRTENYVLAISRITDEGVSVQIKDNSLLYFFEGCSESDFTPQFVEKNELIANIPEIPNRKVLNKLKNHSMWNDYNGRCISCGACTLACSTCTCFTVRDLHYSDNDNVGERRRVSASCQIDGFDTVAGGTAYRKKASDRIRFKMLHKFHDYKERFGEKHMCVGCGRCTARCPEMISITTTLDKMTKAVEEIIVKGENEND